MRNIIDRPIESEDDLDAYRADKAKELKAQDRAVLKVKRRRIVKMCSFIFFAAICLAVLSESYSIGFNISKSIPGRVFLVIKGEVPQKGDIAAFIPPENKYHNTFQFFKYVAGVAGDSVMVEGRAFYVAGHFVGEAKTETLEGEPLEATAAGIIPTDYFYMAGTHVDSFDSRYREIGLVPKSNIVGRAVLLLE